MFQSHKLLESRPQTKEGMEEVTENVEESKRLVKGQSWRPRRNGSGVTALRKIELQKVVCKEGSSRYCCCSSLLSRHKRADGSISKELGNLGRLCRRRQLTVTESLLNLNQSEFSKSEEKNLSNFITYKVVRSPLIPSLASSDHLLPLEHNRVVTVASIAL